MLGTLSGCANVKIVRNGKTENLGRVSVADAFSSSGKKSAASSQDDGLREGTKYWPAFDSPASVDRWARFVAANKGKLLEEANEGTTFFTTSGDWIAASLFTARDGPLLKRLSAEGTVAVVPVYEYAMDGQGFPRARVNWSASQRRHEMARAELGLRVMPFADTRRMHDNIVKAAIDKVMPDSVAGVRQMISGLSGRPDFLITDQTPVHFAVQAQVLYKHSSSGPRYQSVQLDQHFEASKLLSFPLETLLNAKLVLMPMALATSMNIPAGRHALMSTTWNLCAVVNVPELRRQVGTQINSERELRQELSRLIAQQGTTFNEQLKLCPGVLRQQGVVGAFSSSRID